MSLAPDTTMRAATSKVTVIFAVSLVLALAIAAVVVFYPASIRVRVFDPRFHVLAVKILRGTNDTFYIGNQVEGKVRDILVRAHLNVNPLRRINFAGGMTGSSRGNIEPNRILIIVYSWAGPQGDAELMLPQLVDASGSGKTISGYRGGWQNDHCAYWGLDAARTSGAIHLTITEGRLVGEPVNIDGHLATRMVSRGNLADIEIKGLPLAAPKN